MVHNKKDSLLIFLLLSFNCSGARCCVEWTPGPSSQYITGTQLMITLLNAFKHPEKGNTLFPSPLAWAAFHHIHSTFISLNVTFFIESFPSSVCYDVSLLFCYSNRPHSVSLDDFSFEKYTKKHPPHYSYN